jgi:hypothetical protein
MPAAATALPTSRGGRAPRRRAVPGDRFQISTDGWDDYPAAPEEHLGGQID